MQNIEFANLDELQGKASIFEKSYIQYGDDKINSFDKEDRQIRKLYK